MSKVKITPFFGSKSPRKTITVNELANYIATHPAQVIDLAYRHLDNCPTIQNHILSDCTCPEDQLDVVVQVRR